MNRRFRIGIAIISACLIGIAACSVAGAIWWNVTYGAETEYSRSVQLAESYMDTGDYERAILSYWDALEADKTKEEPYLRLIDLYQMQEDYGEILTVLRLGVRNTDSDELVELLRYYEQFGLAGEQKADSDGEPLTVKSNFLQVVAEYTYEQYQRNYGTPTVRYQDGVCTVTYPNVNATFYYYNEEQDRTVNYNTQKPYQDAMPNYAEISDLSLIFGGTVESVSYAELEKLELDALTMTDGEIEFVYNGCTVQIPVDGDGLVIAGTNIKLLPHRIIVQELGTLSLMGTVVDAVSGEGAAGVELRLVPENGTDGEAMTTQTDQNGEYQFENLKEGYYAVQISGDGYIPEEFEVELNGNEKTKDENFVISPEIAAGEVRIVLEWGSYPTDLDSYLFYEMDDGSQGRMFYGERVAMSGDGEIANLDVDNTSGYGPETTTIVDLNGVFRFVVADYHATGTMAEEGATVKIYMPGESSPTVLSVPSSVENAWDVCVIDHGELEITNRPYDGGRSQGSK